MYKESEVKWTETITPSYSKYVCTRGDGFETTSADEMSRHQAVYEHNSTVVEVPAVTKYHEAVAHVVHHDATGHYEEYTDYYYCDCGATK